MRFSLVLEQVHPSLLGRAELEAHVLSTDVQRGWGDLYQPSSTTTRKTMLRSARHVYIYAMPRQMTKHVIIQLCIKVLIAILTESLGILFLSYVCKTTEPMPF
jgi:hypothetical protein